MKEKSKANVALTMIVKDDTEAESFERAIDSTQGVFSHIYVAVTGPSGKHQKIHDIVKKYGGTSISTTPETHPNIYTKRADGTYMFSNFAEARNVSFAMVDKEYDYLCWMDSDDIINSPQDIIKAANRALDLKLDMVYFTYWYAVRTNEQGEVTEVIVRQTRERLMKPNNFKWVGRLHEVCIPKETGFKPKSAEYEFDPKKNQLCLWVHTAEYTDNGEAHNKIVGRNKEILEIQIAEENYKDPRTLLYLGKTLFDIGGKENWDRAKSLFTRFRAMSGWNAERAMSCEYLGLIAAKEDNYRECVRIYIEAISEYPMNVLSYLRLSEAYLNLGLNSFAKHWFDTAIKMETPNSPEVVENPFEQKLIAAGLGYRLALADNDLVKMEEWAKIRKGLMGKDDGLLDEVLKAKALNTAATSTFNLSKWLKDNGHIKIVNSLLELLPVEIINQPYMSIVYKSLVEPRVWGTKEITYFAVAGIEEWTSENLDKGGLGGSEGAVARLSKLWVEKGYKVTVFNDCGSKEGVYDGVTYKPHYKMNWNDEFNILILWRNPSLLDQDIKAKHIFYDAHDIESQTNWTKERMDKVSKVFFKSNWHRRNVPQLPDEKCKVIGNGVVYE